MANMRTVKLKKYTDIVEDLVAAAAITPGHVVELTSAGTVQANSQTDGHFPTMVALEDELQGRSTQDEYAEGDPVQVWYVQPGEEFAAVIASGLDPAIGDLLQVGANGRLVAAAAGTAQFLVKETKEVDDSDIHRIRVKVI